jgi:hypothetical protein
MVSGQTENAMVEEPSIGTTEMCTMKVCGSKASDVDKVLLTMTV